MHGGLEWEVWQDGGIDIHHIAMGVARHNMSAALRAELPLAVRRFGIGGNEVFTLGDCDVFGAPDGVAIHGRGRPGATVLAMAITHGLGRAGDAEFDRTAKALAFICLAHQFPPLMMLR